MDGIWERLRFLEVKQTDTCGLTILVDQEIDFDIGYETNIPWIEAIWGFVARQFKMIRLKRYESV